jgi:hypothetical protein
VSKFVLEHIYPQLDEVGKFIKFGRKKAVLAIKDSLVEFENNHNELKSKHETLAVENANFKNSIDLLNSQLSNSKIDFNELNFTHQELITNHNTLKTKHETLAVENANFKNSIDLLNSKLSNSKIDFNELNFTHQELITNHNTLKTKHETLAVENANFKNSIDLLNSKLSKSKIDFDELNFTYQELITNHNTLKTKHELVANLLSSQKSNNDAMQIFSDLLHNDFMYFANNESSLQEEAKAIITLQNIEKQLQRILNFSEISNKTIVAVGGGFSSGKSEFINSFFKEKSVQLSVGIKPVTAIPTYITSGLKNVIKGYSYQGGVVHIANDLYQELSHDFLKTFNFNLKNIMPIMAIETPIKEYEEICFVDTPGYNPSDNGFYTDQDFSVSEEYLDSSNIILWIIGLDTNGTFPLSDLEFINKLALKGKKIFFVANKADLKCEEDLDDILDIFEEILEDYEIEYEGISAYSSVHIKEISYRKNSLFDFLQQENNQVEVYKQILDKLNSVFDMYRNAINEDIKWTHEIHGSLKSFELDLLQAGYDIGDEMLNERLAKIKNMFDSKSLHKQLDDLEKISSLMTQSVMDIFESIDFNE